MTIIYIIIANLFVSLGGLLGVAVLFIREKQLKLWLNALIAIAAGAMLANAFLHILPEAAHELPPKTLFLALLISLVFFFILEKVIRWRHCHEEDCETHAFGTVNLFGDAVHNFIDGVMIAIAFQVNIELGITTTLAVALHEIPQEITDFGVLLYSGMKKRTAIMANFFVALTSVIGGVVGFLIADKVAILIPYLLVGAAGSFLYIAASDLMPELRKTVKLSVLIRNTMLFLLGIAMIASIQSVIRDDHDVTGNTDSKTHQD